MKKQPLPHEIANMGAGHEDYEAFLHVSSFQATHMLHYHEFYEIFIHLHGGKDYLVNRQTHELTHGTIMLIRPYEIHGHIYYGRLCDYARAYAYFTPEYLKELSCGLVSFEQLLDERLRNGTSFFALPSSQLYQAISLLNQVQKNSSSASSFHRLQDRALLTQFLLLILESIEPETTPQPSSPNTNDEILQIVSYINDHCFEDLSVEQIAKHFGLSRSHISAKFSKSTGHGVYEYILYRRIASARRLIDRGEPLTEIAYRCGFGDYSCFLRNFHKFVGCSPREYQYKSRSV